MKLQICTIAIHPKIAELKPDLLVKLMTLDHYCYPIKDDTGKEAGPKCTLYFKKKLTKNELRKLREAKWPRGLYVNISNTWDNPCLIQNGHDSGYAVWLYELKDIYSILREILQEIKTLYK